MTEKKRFLDQAYRHDASHDDTMALYSAWAEHYDSELVEQGYVTPQRCADALIEAGADRDAPTLDVGCGTGLSGFALKGNGFRCIDGIDMNPEMLARVCPGVYRSLCLVTLAEPLPFGRGTYQQISAMGVIAARHAPAETIGAILGKLDLGGLFVFSLNDHTLDDPRFMAEVDGRVVSGEAEVVFRAYGPHIAVREMGAEVLVLRRL